MKKSKILLLLVAIFSFVACSDSPASSSSSSDEEKIESSSENSAYPPLSGNAAKTIYDAKKQTLTDGRDGHVYKTVSFYNRVWMAENLNYDDVNYSYKSFCPNNDTANCSKYGRLYTWGVAMDSLGVFSADGKGCGASSGMPKCENITGTIRGICPEGWHLPDFAEWNELIYEMKAEGLDVDLTYSGARSLKDYQFYKQDSAAFFWTSRNYNGSEITYFKDGSYYKDVGDYNWGDYVFNKYPSWKNAFAVRCVMNYGEEDAFLNMDRKAVFGTLKDLRDGRIYKTVDIGDQTWMAENLKYEYLEASPEITSCPKDEPANCDSLGRLYTWRAAVDAAAVFSEDAKECRRSDNCTTRHVVSGICPEGWRIPRLEDFEKLVETAGGREFAGQILKGRSGWAYEGQGFDLYGFNVVPYDDLEKAYFWTSDIVPSEMLYFSVAYGFYAISFGGGKAGTDVFKMLPIRCIKYSKADLDSTSLYIKDESLYDSESKTLTDLRDNKVYKTTTIGEQIWMAENLSFNYSWGWVKSYCGNSSMCDNGRFYSWFAAMDSIGIFSNDAKGCGRNACEKSERVRGVCPKGWHLPSIKEWNDLITVAGGGWYAGNRLKARSCWKESSVGTDSLGFSSIAAGVLNFYGVNYRVCEETKYHTSEWDDQTFTSVILDNDHGIYFEKDKYFGYHYSVRCVKDDD